MGDAFDDSFKGFIRYLLEQGKEDDARHYWDYICNRVRDCGKCGICDET